MMQILKTFDNYFTANIWRGKFEAEGIHCFLKDEHSVTIDPILTNAIGGIKLMVDDMDYEKAMDMLKVFEKDYSDQLKCPDCGHLGLVYHARPVSRGWLFSLATKLFDSYAKEVEYVYECPECKLISTSVPDQEIDE